MDIMKILDRVKNILLAPRDEFPKLKSEVVDVPQLYKEYVLIVVAIPYIGLLLNYGTVYGFAYSLKSAIINYLIELFLVYLYAFIVNLLAPFFGSTKDMSNAVKLVAYTSTAGNVAAFFYFLGFLGWLGELLAFVGGLYSGYLFFFVGLPIFMDTPKERVRKYGCAFIVVGCAVILILVLIYMILLFGFLR